MNVFDPGPIRFGDLATAHFLRTQKLPHAVVGIYRLEPRDPVLFHERFGALRGQIGVPYRPVPGLWATVMVIPGKDDFGLFLGMERPHGRARMQASQAFGRVAGALVEESEVRAMLRGYLRQSRGESTVSTIERG